LTTTTTSLPPPNVRAIQEPVGFDESQNASDAVGRTGWDFATATIRSKILWIFLFTMLAAIVFFFFWDILTALPFYAISSVALSLLWYRPIATWLSRSNTYVEVWEPETALLTTYCVGRQRFAELKREGLQNQVSSRYGSSRVFATEFNEESMMLKNTWVHELDPWTYHVERRTLSRLTERVNEVFTDIIDGEALAQVEGRVKAMQAMRRHYSDLDNLFFGTNNPVGEQQVDEDIE
jgi:hypothetical protein